MSAGVGDHSVEAAEALADGRDEAGPVGAAGGIPAEHQAAGIAGYRLQRLAAAPHQHQPHPFAGQAPGTGRAYTAAGAGDEHGAAFHSGYSVRLSTLQWELTGKFDSWPKSPSA
ncbi:hypothetical protein D3C84_468120 [compost metagenome]